MRDKVRQCFRCDVKTELAAYRVKGQPAEPVTVHDHKVSPVEPAGLVQEDDFGQRDRTKRPVDKAPDQLPVCSQGRADIVRLQEGDGPAFGSAPAAPPDQGDIAVIAPVQGFLDGRFPHFPMGTVPGEDIREPIAGMAGILIR